jgi:hypothetical protein
VTEVVATLAAGCFTGAALYIGLVEQPAREACPLPVALAEFRAGFSRARALQATLAVSGAATALSAWGAGRGPRWLVVALALGAVVAVTLVVITPVYRRLLDPALAADSPEARTLLVRWGRLHLVRVGLGLVAFAAAVAGG